MKCIWCNGDQAEESTRDAQWIQSDGSGIVVIKDIPAIHCPTCRDTYLAEEVFQEIDVAIHSVDLDALGKDISYLTLMSAPRLSIFEMINRGDTFGCPH